jgi:hypothetical protein
MGTQHTAPPGADEKLAIQLPEMPPFAISFPASPRENHASQLQTENFKLETRRRRPALYGLFRAKKIFVFFVMNPQRPSFTHYRSAPVPGAAILETQPRRPLTQRSIPRGLLCPGTGSLHFWSTRLNAKINAHPGTPETSQPSCSQLSTTRPDAVGVNPQPFFGAEFLTKAVHRPDLERVCRFSLKDKPTPKLHFLLDNLRNNPA